MHDHSLSWRGTDTKIISDGVKLVLWPKIVLSYRYYVVLGCSFHTKTYQTSVICVSVRKYIPYVRILTQVLIILLLTQLLCVCLLNSHLLSHWLVLYVILVHANTCQVLLATRVQRKTHVRCSNQHKFNGSSCWVFNVAQGQRSTWWILHIA